jgi:Family of unknown function (DUF6111)
MRRALYEVFLFLLPFVLYFLYTRVAPRDEEGKLSHAHPWLWLFVAGLLLVIASFVWLGVTEGAGSRGVYVPARNEHGKVVPGHFENPSPAPTP